MSRRSGTGRQRGIQGPSAIKKNGKGRRHILTTEAQGVLSTLLEDIIEKTLEDTRKMAEAAGKSRVSIEEVERTLATLCQRFRLSRGPNGIIAKIVGGIPSSSNPRPHDNF